MADLELEIVSTADSRGLTQAARDTDKLRGATDKLGDQFHDTAMDSRELDQRVRDIRASVRSLGEEFARTGGPSVKKDLGSQRALLREFERIAKENQGNSLGVTLGTALGSRAGSSAGSAFGENFMEAIEKLPRRARGVLIGGLIGAIAIAAPALGAAISGVVSGAVGAGGIAAGIAASARDPAVKRAWGEFAETAKLEFFAVGSDFADQTVNALGILQRAFRDLDLDESLERIAPFVDELARGVGGFGTEFMSGFNRALEAAGPAIQVLERGLPKLGKALGDAFAIIGEGEGTISGLDFALKLIGATAVGAAKLLDGLGRAFVKLAAVGAVTTQALAPFEKVLAAAFPGQAMIGSVSDVNRALEELVGAQYAGQEGFLSFALAADGSHMVLSKVETAAQRAQRQIDEQTKSFADLRREIFLASDAYGEFIGIQLSQDQANLRVKQGLFELNKTLKETNFDFRDNTEAGLANQAMVLDMIGRFNEQRQANSTTAESTAKATDEFWKQVDSLSGIAGKSKTAKDFLDKLKGRYKITIMWEQIGQAVGAAGQFIASQFKKLFSFQGGGTTPAFAPFQVHDGEMLFSDRQHYVATKAQSQRLGSGGGGTQTFQHTFHFSGDVDTAFATAFQRLVRNGQIKILSSAVVNN